MPHVREVRFDKVRIVAVDVCDRQESAVPAAKQTYMPLVALVHTWSYRGLEATDTCMQCIKMPYPWNSSR